MEKQNTEYKIGFTLHKTAAICVNRVTLEFATDN